MERINSFDTGNEPGDVMELTNEFRKLVSPEFLNDEVMEELKVAWENGNQIYAWGGVDTVNGINIPAMLIFDCKYGTADLVPLDSIISEFHGEEHDNILAKHHRMLHRNYDSCTAFVRLQHLDRSKEMWSPGFGSPMEGFKLPSEIFNEVPAGSVPVFTSVHVPEEW